jgi:hypothetical protein
MTAADIGFNCLSSTSHLHTRRKKVGLKDYLFGNIFPNKHFVKKKMNIQNNIQRIFSYHR